MADLLLVFIAYMLKFVIKQNLLDHLNQMLIRHEKRYGPVPDRSLFEVEDIVVPIHLRNGNGGTRPLSRSGFLSGFQMTRSRTFLTPTSDYSRINFRGSAPDLTQSVPNTPIMHKQQRVKMLNSTISVESVLEESPQKRVANSVYIPPPPSRTRESVVPYGATEQFVEIRRKQGQLLPRISSTLPHKKHPVEDYTLTKVRISTVPINKQESDQQPVLQTFRNTMQPTRSLERRNSNEDIGVVIDRFKAPTSPQPMSAAHSLLHSTSFAIKRPSLLQRQKDSMNGAQSLHNIYEAATDFNYDNGNRREWSKALTLLDDQPKRATSNWGAVRGSNSFADGVPLSAISTYSIPRVSLAPKEENGADVNAKNNRDISKNDSAA